jgi:hypothetical protein
MLPGKAGDLDRVLDINALEPHPLIAATLIVPVPIKLVGKATVTVTFEEV